MVMARATRARPKLPRRSHVHVCANGRDKIQSSAAQICRPRSRPALLCCGKPNGAVTVLSATNPQALRPRIDRATEGVALLDIAERIQKNLISKSES